MLSSDRWLRCVSEEYGSKNWSQARDALAEVALGRRAIRSVQTGAGPSAG
jgi:hypothetical protein